MASQLIRSYWEDTSDKNWYNSLYFSVLNSEPFVQQKSQFLLQLLQHLDVTPDEWILDLHAERGNIAHQLQKAAYQIDGLDLSPSRVKQAKQLHQNGVVIQLNQSIEQLSTHHYKFAYSLNNHFGQLHNEEEQIEYLQQIATTLRPNGHLLIDFFNIQTLLPTLPLQRFQRAQNVLFQLRARQEEQFICEEVRVQDGHYKGAYQSKTHIHFRESFEYLFLRAGLRIVRTYGDYEMQAFHAETSPRLILLVEKR